jgi:hypothetical protein
MGYSRTSQGPGGIATLQSGIGLTYGPTIGSNDSRAPIPMRGLQGCCGQGMGIVGFSVVPGAIEAAVRARTQQSSTSPWIWIVGGLGLFAAIGGIAWYALK